MGFLRGPDIVTTKLLLALDAASPRSYPGSGTTWNNLISKDDDATLSGGGITFNSSEPTNLETDGDSSEIFIPGGDSSNLNFSNTDAFSIESWCNLQEMPSSGNTTAVVCKAFKVGIDIFFPTVSTMVFRCGVRNSEQSIVSQDGSFVSLNEWNHVIFTYTPSNETGVKLYINGTLNATTGNSGQDDFSNNTNYSIGGNEAVAGTARFSNLQTAVVRMYGQELSASQVLQNYDALKNRFV
tara:strand:+ start:31 stop:750 length:720 start_codon:yes stop_codon:yes gene_type:complete